MPDDFSPAICYSTSDMVELMEEEMKKTISLLLIILITLLFVSYAQANGSARIQIITNGYTVFSMKPNGSVMGWGRNTSGEVAIGTNQNQLLPINVPDLSNVKEIIAGEKDTLSFFAIRKDGTVCAWGRNSYGQLGTGDTSRKYLPVEISGLPGVSEIVTNGETVYAITNNGNVYAWGRNDYGQVGNNSTANQTTPVKLATLTGTVRITCSGAVAYAIKEDGTVYAWGKGNLGQIGNNTMISAQKTPIQIPGLTNVEKIISNGSTTFAIYQNGAVYGWGENSFGQIGCYGLSNQYKPVLLSGLSQIKDIIIAAYTTYAIKADGSLYGWGQNNYGQLANTGFFNQLYPLHIAGIPAVKEIFSNGYSTCMLGTDNSVYAWGYNNTGEVGNGQTGPQKSPYKISSLNNISKIVGCNNTLFAIDENGNVYGWGSNHSGQVGNGITTTQRSPVLISELSDITDVQMHINTVIATDTYGNVYGWGANSFGQLGIGTASTILSPVLILQYENEKSDSITTTGSGDVFSTVPVGGTINSTQISITHPVNIFYSIDPNSEDGFYSADFHIQNNSKVPVKIHIESFQASSHGDLVFQDVLPNSMDWHALNTQETQSYIALGLQYVDHTQWLYSQPELMEPLYAVEIDNTFIGALSKESSAAFQLHGYHGLAFDGNYTAKHDLVFVVSLL